MQTDARTLLQSYRISILNLLLFIAILRLTNFNFYLSQIFGFDTQINATGGNAFNFSNYAAIIALSIFVGIKGTAVSTYWKSLSPFALLIALYSINLFAAPYANTTWYLYQMSFIFIAVIIHIYMRKRAEDIEEMLSPWLGLFFWALVVFVLFCVYQILSQVSLYTYLTNFNDSFVQSLDEYGVMKQRHGYLLGFLVSCTLFIRSSFLSKVLLMSLFLFAGFGIRSFLIGLLGAGALFTLRNTRLFILFVAVSCIGLYAISDFYFSNIIFDTRFYSYYNAFDIVQKFPFGVGLGGYPVYTEEFSRNLFAQFYNVNAILDFVPTAPESDYVHLFGSLGLVAALIHIIIQFRLVWYSFSLRQIFTRFEKGILFYFCFMTFFGLSEDSLFSVNYWIFFGLASGIISSGLKRVKLENEIS